MAWAVASLSFPHRPLFTSLAAAAMKRIAEFVGQHFSTTAWAFAVRAVTHAPLSKAIAEAAITRMYDFIL